jgi:hypothetical protein
MMDWYPHSTRRRLYSQSDGSKMDVVKISDPPWAAGPGRILLYPLLVILLTGIVIHMSGTILSDILTRVDMRHAI